MTVHSQFLTMISMCAGGFYLGIARDTFRRFSPYWDHKQVLTYLFEITFWLTQTGLLFYILYRVNAGELRIYIFVACLLGFSIYQVTAATIYKKLLEKVIYLIEHVYHFCGRTFNLLIISPIKWLLYLVLQIIQFIVLLLLWAIQLVLMPIKWLVQLCYSILPKRIKKKIRKLTGVYSIIKDTSIKWLKNMLFKKK